MNLNALQLSLSTVLHAPAPTSCMRILVAGAGIAGLSFARAVQRRLGAGVDVHVWDKIADSSSRSRWGGMGLTPNGVRVLDKQLGVWESLVSTERVLATSAMAVFDGATGKQLMTLAQRGDGYDGGYGFYAVQRSGLVDALAAGLQIQHGVALARLQRGADGRMCATASQDAIAPLDSIDLVVGADGLWSSAASYVSACSPVPWPPMNDLGLLCVRGLVGGHDAFATAAGGVYFVTSRVGASWFLRNLPGKLTQWALTFPSEKPAAGAARTPPVDASLRSRLAAIAGSAFARAPADMHIAALIAAADESRMIAHRLVDRDRLPSWHAADGAPVVLIGDAAHCMSPFQGAGANLALENGALLAALLAVHGGRVPLAAAALDRIAGERAAKAATQARTASLSTHSTSRLARWLHSQLLGLAGAAMARSPQAASQRIPSFNFDVDAALAADLSAARRS